MLFSSSWLKTLSLQRHHEEHEVYEDFLILSTDYWLLFSCRWLHRFLNSYFSLRTSDILRPRRLHWKNQCNFLSKKKLSDVRFQISAFRVQISDFWVLISDFWLLITNYFSHHEGKEVHEVFYNLFFYLVCFFISLNLRAIHIFVVKIFHLFLTSDLWPLTPDLWPLTSALTSPFSSGK